MLPKVLLLAVICLGTAHANLDYGFLQQFHSNFSSLSNEVEFVLQAKRELNGQLIREFNKQILLEFAEIIPRMRLAHHEFLQYVKNRDDASIECQDYVLFLAEIFMWFQEGDIQSCAFLTHNDLRDDALLRFLPYEHEFSRENSRATYQVIQTLGRNNMNDVDAIQYELQDELDYYTNLKDFYMKLLNEELAKHGEDAHITINNLEDCRDYIFFWQDDDHEYLREYLDEDCYIID